MEGTELAKAYVQIVPSAQGISGKIKEALGGDAAGDEAGKSLGASLISGLKKIVAGAAIGKFIKDSLFTGAETEQLIGGIETLYGNSADKMQEYAKQAYKNAGISANDYMSQATSFASALLQSTGGNTEKAASAANQAINDMADNANKFGTDLGSIQNAYQGFAKQNYTMLDNLKLGYGGTKTEMERLLKDAEKLTGVKYDINNLSDVYSAIHAIQEDLGVTGTTAKEAASTFSGSLASMKAAYSNLLGALFTGNDIGEAMADLVESAITFVGGNLIPAIGRILKGIPAAIATAIPMILENIRMALNNARNAILMGGNLEEIGTESIIKFASGVVRSAGLLLDSVRQLIVTAAQWIMANMPTIMAAGKELLNSLVTGIKNNFPTLVANAWQIVQNIANAIIQNLPQILQAGITLMGKLLAGILNGISALLAGLPQVITAVKSYFQNVDWASVGRNIIIGIKNGLVAAGHMLWDAVKGLLGSFKDNVLAFFGIHSPSRWGAWVGQMIDAGIAGGITDGSPMLQRAVDDLTMGVASPVGNLLSTQAAMNSAYSASGTNGTGQIIELLRTIAEKDTRIILHDREVNRALREMGVAYN